MSSVILEGSMIRNFVEDEKIFIGWVRDRFDQLDLNRNGSLSYAEMVKEFEDLRLGVDTELDQEQLDRDQVYGEVFSEFDRNSDGKVDFDEFAEGMRQIVLAVADGIGFTPVEMVVEDGGFLKKIVKRESPAPKQTA